MAEGVTASSLSSMLRQLGELCGHPVRVTVMDPKSNERLNRVSGVLTAVDRAGLTVDCVQAISLMPASSPVTVEILEEGNLYFFHTSFNPEGTGREQLRLKLPSLVQTTQRRRYPRVDLDIPVHVMVNDGSQAVAAVLRDISAGGASLRFEKPIPEYQRVNLVFHLGTGLFFQNLEAETVRCTGTVDGVYIVALRFFCQPDQEVALAAWVNRQLEG